MRLQGRPLARIRQDALNRLLEGHKILVRRVNEKGTLVRATGAARFRLQHDSSDRAGKANNKPGDNLAQTADLELRAGDIRLVPFLTPAYTHEMHHRALPAGVLVITDYPHRSSYLLADNNVRLIQRDPTGRIVGRGFGDHLVLRFSDEAQSVDGRLDGDIARMLRMDKNDCEHIGEARRIHFASDKRGQHVLLVRMDGVDPRLTLPSSTASEHGLGGGEGGSEPCHATALGENEVPAAGVRLAATQASGRDAALPVAVAVQRRGPRCVGARLEAPRVLDGREKDRRPRLGIAGHRERNVDHAVPAGARNDECGESRRGMPVPSAPHRLPRRSPPR